MNNQRALDSFADQFSVMAKTASREEDALIGASLGVPIGALLGVGGSRIGT